MKFSLQPFFGFAVFVDTITYRGIKLITTVIPYLFYILKKLSDFVVPFICSNSHVLNKRLLFWKDGSRPPISSWNLPFWDYRSLNARSLWIFQVDHNFINSMWKSWLLVTKLSVYAAPGYHLIMSSRSVSTKARIVLAQAKQAPGMSLKINTIWIFQTKKSAVKLNRLTSKFFMLCHVDIQESSRKKDAKFNFLW